MSTTYQTFAVDAAVSEDYFKPLAKNLVSQDVLIMQYKKLLDICEVYVAIFSKTEY